tara:strand:- start:8038 stop:9009 length:972 start_codon:yes stop_codon:yes gene_type:complete
MSEENITINLISGGAGFIGSNLIERLLNMGEKVICLDNFLSSSNNIIKKWNQNPNFKLFNQSVIDDIDENVDIDMIWHLASPASPKYYYENPIHTSYIIFQGTLNLLNYALKKNAKFFLASSSEIYGEAEDLPIRESYYGNLKTTSKRSCYAEAKRISETLCYDFHRKYKLDIRIARIFNAYGPNMSLSDGRVINTFIKNCIMNVPLSIYGNGNQTRSFCYIEDLLDGFFLLKDVEIINPINLGYPLETKIIHLAELIKTKTNSNSVIKFEQFNENEPLRRIPSIEKAKKLLNWQPNISLDLGLDYTIDYFNNLVKRNSLNDL